MGFIVNFEFKNLLRDTFLGFLDSGRDLTLVCSDGKKSKEVTIRGIRNYTVLGRNRRFSTYVVEGKSLVPVEIEMEEREPPEDAFLSGNFSYQKRGQDE